MRVASVFQFGIRQKMVLVLLAVLTVALGTTSWFTIHQQEQNILRETKQHGEDLARIVSQSLAFSIVGYDYHTIQLLLDEITRSHDLGYAKVLSTKGNVMAESGSPPDARTSWTMFTQDIVFDRKTVGQLVLGLDNTGIIKRLEGQKTSLISREALIIVLIALGEFLALSYLIVRPVSIISRSLNQSIDASGRITHQIPIASTDEFGLLASQFNDMREQLNEANSRLQSKIEVADAKLTENNRRLTEQAGELQRMNEELQRLATTDPLTGLYNRRYFSAAVESDLALAVRHGDVNSILALDIDHFKKVNDTYGHQAGDQVLVEVANILTKTLRKTDLVCRMGGEEFVMLCRRTQMRESMAIADKLRKEIEAHAFTGIDHAVTVSIGIVTFPEGALVRGVDEYVHEADVALYRSKTGGRNRVTHYAEMDNRSIEFGRRLSQEHG